jgi:DNA-directed RNA polymerase specialized sigma24 family protein
LLEDGWLDRQQVPIAPPTNPGFRPKRSETLAHLETVRTMQEIMSPSAAEPGGRLAELYERHVGRAVGLARLLTGEPDAAEDIAHDAFIRVAGRFAHLRDQASFEAYYRRAVVNACRARLRRSRIERRYLRLSIPLSTPLTDAGPEERDRLWAAIRQLPERQAGRGRPSLLRRPV